MATEMVPENGNALGVSITRFFAGEEVGMAFQFTTKNGFCVISLKEIEARINVEERNRK